MAHAWNGCSQSSRFLPQARRIVGSGVENALCRPRLVEEDVISPVLPSCRRREYFALVYPRQMFQSTLFLVILIRMFLRFIYFVILVYNTTLRYENVNKNIRRRSKVLQSGAFIKMVLIINILLRFHVFCWFLCSMRWWKAVLMIKTIAFQQLELVFFLWTFSGHILFVTKNYCVTWIIRVYANLVQKLREYLISLCHGD